MKAICIVALGLLGLGVLAVGSAPIGGKSKAQAPIIVAFDMIIDDDGDTTINNFCPGLGNAGGTDCTLGTIDDCVAISDGATIEFDIVMQGMSDGANIAGPDVYIGWPGAPFIFNLTGQTETTSTVNIIVDDPASYVMCMSDGVPDNISPHQNNCGEINAGAAEGNPPFSQGILYRYTATVGPGVPPGLYGLYLTASNAGIPTDPILGNNVGICLCILYGCTYLDYASDPAHGLIAVDQPCPGAVGGIAELPEVSDSSTPNYIVLAGLAAVALVALAAGAWYAGRRWLG